MNWSSIKTKDAVGEAVWGLLNQSVLERVAFPLKEQFCRLGMLLDPDLHLEAPVFSVTSIAFYKLWLDTAVPWIVKSGHSDPWPDHIDVRLVQCVLLSRTCPAYYRGGDCIIPELNDLHRLPISFWAQFKVLVLNSDALNGLQTGYVKACLLPYCPPHHQVSITRLALCDPTCGDETGGDETGGEHRQGFFNSGTLPEECLPTCPGFSRH